MTTSQIGDLLGFTGAAAILIGFAYQTLRNAKPDLRSTLLNFTGASLLAISLMINLNIPALVLEITWALISLIGLVRLKKMSS